ncbi:MAG: EF-hand domain-containing protein [Planctomycetes bacterium]|nr:EF-hand domain-containing protein [Planctomycetota bacterium]
MRHAAAARLLPILGVLFAIPSASVRADGPGNDPDQYEEKIIARAAERAAKVAKSDRLVWVRELENAFPNRVGNPTKEEEYGAWFALVAGKGDEWRRDSTTNTGFAELFEKVVQRLELGPVPSIRRDEFLKYARRTLVPAQTANAELNEEFDKVFRVLDRDGDGVLSGDEMTTKLRADRLQSDIDGNGRIDKDEYRSHFNRRIAIGVDALNARVERERGSDSKSTSSTPKSGLPTWFAELDADKDGQIALSEWRKAGRAINVFMEMDLDGDGLLTKEEYQRYVKLKEKEEANDRLTGMPMMGKQAMK